MDLPVAGCAESDQVLLFVTTSVSLVLDVMDFLDRMLMTQAAKATGSHDERLVSRVRDPAGVAHDPT